MDNLDTEVFVVLSYNDDQYFMVRDRYNNVTVGDFTSHDHDTRAGRLVLAQEFRKRLVRKFNEPDPEGFDAAIGSPYGSGEEDFELVKDRAKWAVDQVKGVKS